MTASAPATGTSANGRQSTVKPVSIRSAARAEISRGIVQLHATYYGRGPTKSKTYIVEDLVDIALYDSFAQPESDHAEIQVLVENPRARRVVVYTWNFDPELVESACRQGASGYQSKTLGARELVEALEAVHAALASVMLPVQGAPWEGRQR